MREQRASSLIRKGENLDQENSGQQKLFHGLYFSTEDIYTCTVASPKAKSPLPPLFDRIKECIEQRIRPYIQMDGGDIELVELTKEKILKVRLHGACVGCMASSITLQYGVQNAINEEFPDEDIQLELVE